VDDRLRSEFVREITDFLERNWPAPAAEGGHAIAERQLQMAAAILMVCVVHADHASRQDEHRVLERALGRGLDIGAEEAAVVVRTAEESIERGGSFSQSLARLDARCTREQKRRLVESLWRIAFADAELAGQEEYLVRKIAGRLSLTTADLVETKVRAREAFLREDL